MTTVYVLQCCQRYEGCELLGLYHDEDKATAEKERLAVKWDDNEYSFHTVTPMEVR